MLKANALEFEDLVERACHARLLQYKRVNGETVTLQIGRVVYTTSRERAVGLLRGALASAAGRAVETAPASEG